MSLFPIKGMTLGAFGGVAGFFALYFFGDVPRVRKDIYEKLPVVGQFFAKEIPPSDNNVLSATQYIGRGDENVKNM
ncbi:hypothetical protein HI914_06977 [Erysiphe necator]|nr:hypothetical protein HI914_06977 [Erysiphe necator]